MSLPLIYAQHLEQFPLLSFVLSLSLPSSSLHLFASLSSWQLQPWPKTMELSLTPLSHAPYIQPVRKSCWISFWSCLHRNWSSHHFSCKQATIISLAWLLKQPPWLSLLLTFFSEAYSQHISSKILLKLKSPLLQAFQWLPVSFRVKKQNRLQGPM